MIESTYGDRLHGTERPDYVGDLTRILRETFDRGGNLVIPSFAVGRTQELLYFFREIKEKRLLPQYQNFEVYVDSPLAIEATNVFNKNVKSCFDEEALSLVEQGINPLIFPGLRTTITSDESKMINLDEKPKVILSASGMCEAGRIRHHLKHNLWRKESTICFVGYQAVGTLGRKTDRRSGGGEALWRDGGGKRPDRNAPGDQRTCGQKWIAGMAGRVPEGAGPCVRGTRRGYGD